MSAKLFTFLIQACSHDLNIVNQYLCNILLSFFLFFQQSTSKLALICREAGDLYFFISAVYYTNNSTTAFCLLHAKFLTSLETKKKKKKQQFLNSRFAFRHSAVYSPFPCLKTPRSITTELSFAHVQLFISLCQEFSRPSTCQHPQHIGRQAHIWHMVQSGAAHPSLLPLNSQYVQGKRQRKPASACTAISTLKNSAHPLAESLGICPQPLRNRFQGIQQIQKHGQTAKGCSSGENTEHFRLEGGQLGWICTKIHISTLVLNDATRVSRQLVCKFGIVFIKMRQGKCISATRQVNMLYIMKP